MDEIIILEKNAEPNPYRIYKSHGLNIKKQVDIKGWKEIHHANSTQRRMEWLYHIR